MATNALAAVDQTAMGVVSGKFCVSVSAVKLYYQCFDSHRSAPWATFRWPGATPGDYFVKIWFSVQCIQKLSARCGARCWTFEVPVAVQYSVQPPLLFTFEQSVIWLNPVSVVNRSGS